MESVEAHFKQFSELVQSTVKKTGSYIGKKAKARLRELQRQNMAELLATEEKFRQILINSDHCRAAYEGFVNFICEERRNILVARPYWRARQELFTAEISPALKDRNWRRLLRYHPNYQFIGFVIRHLDLPPDSDLRAVATKIQNIRFGLVELNLPLVINRVKLFFNKTPRSHLSFMDEIQIATEGLIAGIDKFVPSENYDWSNVAGVAIGRITGNLIAEYNSTQLHFYPSDKRKIYRANKILSRHPHGVSLDDVTSMLNTGARTDQQTDSAEIRDLIAAASTISSDTQSQDLEDVPASIKNFASPDEDRPDVRVEAASSMNLMLSKIQELPVWDQKILRLKGIKF